MRTLIHVQTGVCEITQEILGNWKNHVSFLLKHCKKEHEGNRSVFLVNLAVKLLSDNVSLEGYIVCSVLGKSFDVRYLLSHSSMNTLLHSLEINLALTIICKLLRLKEHLPLLAFYRALIYLR
jgi:hypothetical protein